SWPARTDVLSRSTRHRAALRSETWARPRCDGGGALSRQGAAQPPELLPFRHIFVEDLERLLGRHAGAQRLDLGRRFREVGSGNVAARRAPSHGLDVERLAFLREQMVEEEPGRVGMRRPLEYADRPRLARDALPGPDAAHRHRGRRDAKVVQMEIRHFGRAGIFSGGDLLRHARMAALKRRLVLAQRLDEVPAEFGAIHDRDDPVVAGPGYFEVVDGQLVAPV